MQAVIKELLTYIMKAQELFTDTKTAVKYIPITIIDGEIGPDIQKLL